MILRQRGQSGEVIRVEGASFLKVRNNRIYYHRDYFDLGAFVYENVPMLGSIIKRIKQATCQLAIFAQRVRILGNALIRALTKG